MKQKNEKISEMEKTLLETSNKLREAEDSLKQRQVYIQDSISFEDRDRHYHYM